LLVDETLAASGSAAHVHWTEDGLVLRVPDGAPLPGRDVLVPSPEGIAERLLRCLRGTTLFAASFRENAARALLLPRKPGRGRTPLWTARLRARDLATAVSDQRDFPITVETVRDLLCDRFDLDALAERLAAVRDGQIECVAVDAAGASPWARGLLVLGSLEVPARPR
jgi:ATP-dependent Lhr-like helicase